MISLYVVTFMHVFRNDCSALDNQLVWSSQGRLFCSRLSWVAYNSLCSLRPFPSALLVGAILVELTFSQSCWWDFMGVPSDIPKDTVSQQTPWSPDSYSLPQWSLTLRYRSCVVDVSVMTEFHNTVFWLVVVFYNGLHLLKDKLLWLGEQITLICAHKGQVFKMQLWVILV